MLPPLEGDYHCGFPDFGGYEDCVTTAALKEFAALAGKPPVWATFSNNWFDEIRFPEEKAAIIRDFGSIPHIRMMPRARDAADDVPSNPYPLLSILEGTWDVELCAWAADAKAFADPIVLEFGTEVNGDWFPWNGMHNGGPNLGPERFRHAYRHIVELFRNVGADNVTWVFHVNSDDYPDADCNRMEHYYPGDDYVDWVGVSAYGPQNGQQPFRTFCSAMRSCYSRLTEIAPTKPFAVLEFGIHEDEKHWSKAAWIASALQSISNGEYPGVKAVGYWNESWRELDGTAPGRCDHCLKLDSSKSAKRAYQKQISNPFFQTSPRISGG